jgi:hypothetical protein
MCCIAPITFSIQYITKRVPRAPFRSSPRLLKDLAAALPRFSKMLKSRRRINPLLVDLLLF